MNKSESVRVSLKGILFIENWGDLHRNHPGVKGCKEQDLGCVLLPCLLLNRAFAAYFHVQ